MKVSWLSSPSQLSRDVNGGEVSKCDQRIFYFSVSETISRAIRRFFAHWQSIIYYRRQFCLSSLKTSFISSPLPPTAGPFINFFLFHYFPLKVKIC